MLLQNKLVSCQMALRNIYNRLPNLLWDLLPNFLQKICGVPPYKTDNNQEAGHPSFHQVPSVWKRHIKNYIMKGAIFGRMHEGEDRVACTGGTRTHMFGKMSKLCLSMGYSSENPGSEEYSTEQMEHLRDVRTQMWEYLCEITKETHVPFLYGVLRDDVFGTLIVVLDDHVSVITVDVGMVPFTETPYCAAFMCIKKYGKWKKDAIVREMTGPGVSGAWYIIPGKDAKKNPKQVTKEPYEGGIDKALEFLDLGRVGWIDLTRRGGPIDPDFSVSTSIEYAYYSLFPF